MNKYVLLAIALFVASFPALADNKKDEKFVNPIFNKTLHPLATRNLNWDMILTPTKITLHNTKTGTLVEQNCYLADNQEMSVTFNCEGLYVRPNREKIVCTRMPENDEPYYRGMYVLCKTAYQRRDDKYNTDEAHYSKISPYIIDFD